MSDEALTTGAIADDLAANRPRSASRRLLFLVPAAVFLALLGLLAVRLGAGDPSVVPSALIGRPAPNLVLPALPGLHDADGRAVPGLTDSDLKGGHVTVINVWASWCAPCREEAPGLLALAKDPAIRLVGIDYKDKSENARRFLGTFGNPFAAVGTDEAGHKAIDWGVYGVPETFVVGPDGTIRYKQVGPLTPGGMRGFLEQVRAAAHGK